MALKEQIQNDLKAAMLSGDRFVSDVLRNLKASILNEEVATSKRDEGLDDTEVEKVLIREVKKRVEAAKMYRDNNRPELAEPEEQEAEVLKRYLPEQLDDDAIREVVRAKIAQLGVSGPQTMGQVIGAVKQDVGSSADGALIARIVKEELTQN